ncbi:MAG: DUF5317 family protein [Dehalococcoidia bacterium]
MAALTSGNRPLIVRPWLVPAALLCQVAGVYLLPATDGAVGRRLCMVATYALLLLVVWLNRRLRGVRILALGLALNALAIAIGHGLMPVTARTMRAAGLGQAVVGLRPGAVVPHSKDVVVAAPPAAVAWLIDSIPVHSGVFRYAVSPGDLVILVGAVLSLAEVVAIVGSGAVSRQAGAPAGRDTAGQALDPAG